MSTALTLGTFDLVHPGHVRLLEACRELVGPEGEVVATVNADDFVRSYKGRDPVMPDWDRARVVKALWPVDRCFIHRGGPDAKLTISQVEPDLIVIGSDWQDRDYLGQLSVTQEWLDERGIVIVYVPLLAGHSSTRLRERMAA